MSTLQVLPPNAAAQPLDLAGLRQFLSASMAEQEARAQRTPLRRMRRVLDRPAPRRAAMTAGGGLWLWVSRFLWTAAPTTLEEPFATEPTGAWTEVSRPFELYMIASPDLANPTSYSAQRHRGGGRRDTMTFGDPSGSDPHLRMTFYRAGAEQTPVPSFWVEMARRAADGSLSVERTAVPDHLKTRFGNFDVADIQVSTGAATRACLGFRMAASAPDFRVSGFACGAREHPIDRSALSCLIDRIDLVAAGDDKELSLFFARSETGRQPECFGARGAKASNWLAPQAGAPALRAAAARAR